MTMHWLGARSRTLGKSFTWKARGLASVALAGAAALLFLAAGPVQAQVPGFCSDRVIDVGLGEECDDGNVADEDGCSSGCLIEAGFVCSGEPSRCVLEGQQSREQIRCIVSLNRDLQKVALTVGRELSSCVRGLVLGRPDGPLEDCIATDSRRRIGLAQNRTLINAGFNCKTPPDFGPSDPNRVNAAAVEKEDDILHAIFGEDLDSGVFNNPVRNRTKPRCQVSVIRSILLCQNTYLAAFNRCKSDGLRSGAIRSSADLEGCWNEDPRFSIGRSCSGGGRLSRDLGLRCEQRGVDLSEAFPGCGKSDAEELADCMERIIRCRTCLALNAVDGLGLDCDLEDDGLANLSCE